MYCRTFRVSLDLVSLGFKRGGDQQPDHDPSRPHRGQHLGAGRPDLTVGQPPTDGGRRPGTPPTIRWRQHGQPLCPGGTEPGHVGGEDPTQPEVAGGIDQTVTRVPGAGRASQTRAWTRASTGATAGPKRDPDEVVPQA